MQEEIEQKTVNLMISTTKLTMKTLAQIALKYLNHRKMRVGKHTVKQLLRQGQGISSVDVAKTDLKEFEKEARKYGIDYAVRKDMTADPPKYLVFFKARDADVMTAAFQEYTKRVLDREKKPSILAQLKKLQALVMELPGKMRREKEKEQSL